MRTLLFAITLTAALVISAPAIAADPEPATSIKYLTTLSCGDQDAETMVLALRVNERGSLVPGAFLDFVSITSARCQDQAIYIGSLLIQMNPDKAPQIIKAVIYALPPSRQKAAAAELMEVAGDAGSGSMDDFDFTPVPNDNRTNLGAPLIAPHTDIPTSPVR